MLAARTVGDFMFITETVSGGRGRRGGQGINNDKFYVIQKRVLGHSAVWWRRQNRDKLGKTRVQRQGAGGRCHHRGHRNTEGGEGLLIKRIAGFKAINNLL